MSNLHHRVSIGALLVGLAISPYILTASADEPNVIEMARQNRITCITTSHKSPIYAQIVKHFPMWVSDVTILQLADKTSPTKKEKILISSYDQDVKACDPPYFSLVQAQAPTLGSILASERSIEDDAWTDLVLGKLNWGGFNKRLKDIYSDGAARFSAEVQRLTDIAAREAQEQAQQRAQEQAQQQAIAAQQQEQAQRAAEFQEALDAQRRAAAAQMIFNGLQNLSRPTPQTNCTTNYQLGTAYTHCQ